MLQESDLNLAKAIKLRNATEESKKHLKNLKDALSINRISETSKHETMSRRDNIIKCC